MRRLFVFFGIVLAHAAALRGADYVIDTVAGSSWVGDNGPATSALLFQAEGIAADQNGNLFVADAADHRVRRISADGTIHTVAGTGVRGFSGDGGDAAAARLNSPYGLAVDPQGNLYIADLGNARVRRVTPKGIISTVAGDGGTLVSPRNLAVDAVGNVFVSDFGGHRVYRIGSSGALSMVAGIGTPGSSGDGGDATRSQLSYPAGITVDARGALYIADSGNHLVRKVSQGIISSVARAATPTGLALDGLGNVYAADPSAGQLLRVSESGAVTAVSVAAHDLCLSTDGFLYVSTGAAVLRMTYSGAFTVRAGGGNSAYGDAGGARLARLNHPSGVAFDSAGNLFIADRDNHRVRRVSADGTITTAAGTGKAGSGGDGGLAVQAQLNIPSSVSVDVAGNLYIADTGNRSVRKVSPDGKITTAVSVGIVSPVYAVVDPAGNIYIADADAGKILKASNSGIPATLVSGLASPRGLALDTQGNLYFTEAGAARVRRLSLDGTLTNLGAGVGSIPRGVAVDAAGDVFVADPGLQRVFRIDPSGQAVAIAGTGIAGFSGDGASALSAELGYPWDVAIAANGMIAIADLDNSRVRALTAPVVTAPSAITIPDAVNGASLLPGPVAPGMLLLLRNTGLEAAVPADLTVLAGVFPARVLSAGSNGILIFVPPQISGASSISLSVIYKGTLAATIPLSVAGAAPGLFATIGNEDESVNSASQPAARGSLIALYGTGLGDYGSSATVSLGGYDAEVVYAGPVQGYPGLFQINAHVPAGYLPSGNLSVIVSAGQASSQAGVTVWIN